MHEFDNYDYSARMMYPAIGDRFMSVDTLCEKYYSISPYAYCAGNPVRYVDPDGRKIVYKLYNPNQKKLDKSTPDQTYGDNEEKRVIQGSEHETAKNWVK